jgi:hypothetical protein
VREINYIGKGLAGRYIQDSDIENHGNTTAKLWSGIGGRRGFISLTPDFRLHQTWQAREKMSLEKMRRWIEDRVDDVIIWKSRCKDLSVK